MILFLDCEFTGLRQDTSLISLALVAQDGQEFYAEFCDYDPTQCDRWIHDNVLSQTRWLQVPAAMPGKWMEGNLTLCFGDQQQVRAELDRWLDSFERVEIWADCPAWDWVLFCQLYGGAMHIPKQIFYLPFDLVTLFKLNGIDPDVDRNAFGGDAKQMAADGRHHALYDARLLKVCYDKLMLQRCV